MVIKFYCENCGQKLSAEENQSGVTMPCPSCSSLITIPINPNPVDKEPPLHQTSNYDFEVLPLALRYPESSQKTKWMFIATLLFFFLGILSPLITINKHVGFWGFTIFNERNTVSLASGLLSLISEGHLLLFLIIFLFSIAFPTAKNGILYILWYHGLPPSEEHRLVKLLGVTGKWSMLDVLVVGLLVVVLKLGDLVTVQVHAGVLFFSVSVITSMLINSHTQKLISLNPKSQIYNSEDVLALSNHGGIKYINKFVCYVKNNLSGKTGYSIVGCISLFIIAISLALIGLISIGCGLVMLVSNNSYESGGGFIAATLGVVFGIASFVPGFFGIRIFLAKPMVR